MIHTLCTNHYLDLIITFIICINVITMSLEHYNQPHVRFLPLCANLYLCIVYVFGLYSSVGTNAWECRGRRSSCVLVSVDV